MSVIDWPSAVVILQERLARAEKVIDAAVVVSRDAWPLPQVDNQPTIFWRVPATSLHAFREVFAEYDRPSAPLDGSGNGETQPQRA